MKFNLKFRELNSAFNLSFGEIRLVSVSDDLPIYYGQHDVIPNANIDTVLPTKETILLDDIRVYKVPYSETSNSSNGKTITIG